MSISDLWSNTDLCATCWKSNFAECRVRLQKTAVSKCIQIFTFMLQSMHDGVIWEWISVLNGKGRQSLVVALADGWPIKGVSWVTGFSRNDGKPDMSGYLYQEDFTIEFSFSFFFYSSTRWTRDSAMLQPEMKTDHRSWRPESAFAFQTIAPSSCFWPCLS